MTQALAAGIDHHLMACLGIAYSHESHVGQFFCPLVIHLYGDDIMFLVGDDELAVEITPHKEVA